MFCGSLDDNQRLDSSLLDAGGAGSCSLAVTVLAGRDSSGLEVIVSRGIETGFGLLLPRELSPFTLRIVNHSSNEAKTSNKAATAFSMKPVRTAS
jgi:hypothetical protein